MRCPVFRFAIPVMFCLATPVGAQTDWSSDLFDRAPGGLEGLLDELLDGMDEALGTLEYWAETFGPSFQSFLTEMGPGLADLMDEVEDWAAYETPELLPNGDIIIRKKPDILPQPGDPEGDPPGREDQPAEAIDI
ncbi:MAG: hypothetical protein AAGF79_13170 [Pseudomonadota bacterium]